MSYRPTGAFTTPLVILKPESKYVSGVLKKTFPTIEEALNKDANNLFFWQF